jgi:hypothetical protein
VIASRVVLERIAGDRLIGSRVRKSCRSLATFQGFVEGFDVPPPILAHPNLALPVILCSGVAITACIAGIVSGLVLGHWQGDARWIILCLQTCVILYSSLETYSVLRFIPVVAPHIESVEIICIFPPCRWPCRPRSYDQRQEVFCTTAWMHLICVGPLSPAFKFVGPCVCVTCHCRIGDSVAPLDVLLLEVWSR